MYRVFLTSGQQEVQNATTGESSAQSDGNPVWLKSPDVKPVLRRRRERIPQIPPPIQFPGDLGSEIERNVSEMDKAGISAPPPISGLI